MRESEELPQDRRKEWLFFGIAILAMIVVPAFLVMTETWWLLALLVAATASSAHAAWKAGLPLWPGHQRRRELIEIPDPPPLNADAARALTLIDKLDDLVHHAPELPTSERRRLDEAPLREDLARLGEALRAAVPSRRRAIDRDLAQMEQLIDGARRVPVTRQVVIAPDAYYEILDRLRDSLSAQVL